GQRTEDCRLSIGIGMQDDIVQDHRRWTVQVDMALEARQAQGQVELLSGSFAHCLDRRPFAVAPNAHENRLITRINAHLQALEAPPVKRGNSSSARSNSGPLCWRR